jgi:alkylation response protein AidB-like acyl-CoA dehydrogenase
MHFDLSEEQRLLKDTVERFVAREYGFERRRTIIESEEGISRDIWSQLAELGLLALPFAEGDGGLGGGPVEMMVVGEAFGRALLVEPWFASVVLAGSVLRSAASPLQREAWLPGLIAGTQFATLAHFEPGSRYETARVTAQARTIAGGHVLSGAKSGVPHAHVADHILVSARHTDADDDVQGISLFAVPRDAEGLVLRSHATHDGQRAADLQLHEVVLPKCALIGPLGGALPIIEHALDRGIAALCAFAVGTMSALYEATLEHVKTRQQFGVPIGKFQALQHRMAEMLMHLEHARSMLLLATARAEIVDTALRQRTLSAAKAVIGQCARFVGQQAVQLHGGMGVTDELIVSHHFKSLTVFNLQLGDSEHHLARVSDALLRESALAA